MSGFTPAVYGNDIRWTTCVALPAHLVADNGLCILKENPYLRTYIRIAVADLDVTSSYPNNGIALNISKENLRGEIIRIHNVPTFDARMQGLNLMSGQTNAVEFVTTMFHMPLIDQWTQIYDQVHNPTQVEPEPQKIAVNE